MCGIGLTFAHPTHEKIDDLSKLIQDALISRGPDDQSSRTYIDNDNEWTLNLFAAVLHMRGEKMIQQPYSSSSLCGQYCFCWNGECYSHDEAYGMPSFDIANLDSNSENESDTVRVMQMIQNAIDERAGKLNGFSSKEEHGAIVSALSRVHGEYSFILLSETSNCLYFGRDPLGRRSLLMSKMNSVDNESSEMGSTSTSKDEPFVIASVVPDTNGFQSSMVEIEAGKVYRLELQSGLLTHLSLQPLQNVPKDNINGFDRKYNGLVEWDEISKQMALDGMNISPKIIDAAKHLHYHLNEAVRRRVVNAPISPVLNDDMEIDASVAILFSGGVDSVVTAALCDNHIPKEQPIDLINVAFASKSNNCNGDPFMHSPDRQAALLSYNEMLLNYPTRKWRFIAVDVDYSEVLKEEQTIRNLISPLSSTMDFNIATAFWFASRGQGEILDSKNFQLSSEHLRFAGERSLIKDQSCSTYGCTRKVQDGCIFDSCKVCCSSNYLRLINKYLGGRADLCEVHAVKKGVKSAKKKSKKQPSQNMKYGKKQEQSIETTSQGRMRFLSSARVILVGIGADEQLAGYGRHRVTYERGGYDALREELKMEKSRLWTRNLGRDDRCISNHGKESRFPFLDENVVSYINSLDVTNICDMTIHQGVGEKLILRLVAKHIGVSNCSNLVKRAIQFGSRIAKCSDVDRFGSSRKASGNAQLNPTRIDN